MPYDITELIKKSPKREAGFHRRQAEFLGQMECDFQVSENPLPNKEDSPRCISECYSEEMWNFDEAAGMATRQCQ